jgi:hypothetical protein
MYLPFNEISEKARIWIYQSDQEISPSQKEVIGNFLIEYCDTWQAHGQPLRASFDVRLDRFVIIAADESFNATSGCSVDDSVRAIKQVETLAGLNFFDRNQIGFKNDKGVFLVSLSALKQKFAERIWNGETLAFNNLVSTKNQLDREWVVPAGKTWLKRYLPAESLKT